MQTGIGAIPAAILANLKNKNDLGMHGGLIDDGGMALIRDGNVTGARKPIDLNRHITGMAIGSRALIDWLADTPEVVFKSANIHARRWRDPAVAGLRLRELRRGNRPHGPGEMRNTPGGRQISGTGGSVDFMRAARLSPGGRSIIAMTAAARRGTASRIVPRVEVVTALRTDVDIVVTEYGIAELRNLPLAGRAQRP